MKRLASLLLIVVIIATMSGPVLADKKDKGKEFNPNKLITKDEFFSSFSSLLEDYGYSWKPIEGKDKLTREEMVLVIGDFLIEEGVIPRGTSDIPFKDIKNMDKLEKEILMGLYDKGIIKGKTKNTFNPKSKVSYGEARMVLERIGKLLDKKWDKTDKNIIPFKVKEIVESYNGKEGIVVEEGKDKLLVSITKQFPTPNFAMAVEKIVANRGQYEVHIITAPPKKDIQIQVIRYKTIYLEIDKDDIGKPPYKFVM